MTGHPRSFGWIRWTSCSTCFLPVWLNTVWLVDSFSWFYSEFDRDPGCWRETCSSCSQLSPDPITSRRQDLSSAIHMEAGIHVSMMPDVTKSQDVIDWCLPQESLCILITEHIGYFVTFCWWFSISTLAYLARFSMLVPNSTNLSAVVNHISSKDWSTQVNVYEKRKSHSSHSVCIHFGSRTSTKRAKSCAPSCEG